LTKPVPGIILMIVKMSKLRTDHFFKAISDPTRRRILKLLKKRSMTAGRIADSFSITPGSLSHHFNVLKAADLVRAERHGQQIIYSLNTSVFEDAATMLADLFKLEEK
jgi:ArsR family transcriptional regulator, repressor of sdpIR and other operons